MGHFFMSIFPSAIGTNLKYCEIQLGTYIGGEIWRTAGVIPDFPLYNRFQNLLCNLTLHCKKRLAIFPSSAGMTLTQL